MIKKMIKKQLQAIGFGTVMSLSGIAALESAARAEAPPFWYNCLSREAFTPEKQAWCDRWQILQDVTLIVPTQLDPNPQYKTVTLENGRYQQDDRRLIVELVNEQGWQTFGDLNGDGKEDAAVIFGVALDPDGQSVATFLTTVLDIDGEAQALLPIRLGERILLSEPIAIEPDRVVVPFLTQTEVIYRAYGIGSTLVELPQTQGYPPAHPIR